MLDIFCSYLHIRALASPSCSVSWRAGPYGLEVALVFGLQSRFTGWEAPAEDGRRIMQPDYA